jgi:hypothetical protein
MGVKDDAIRVAFKSIAEDPTYRTLTGAALAFQTGAINQQEYRNLVLDRLDVKPTTDELPTPNEFTGAQTVNPDLPAENSLKIAKMGQDAQLQIAAQNAKAKPVPSQGNSGAVGSGLNGGNELRDNENKPGTSGAKKK